MEAGPPGGWRLGECGEQPSRDPPNLWGREDDRLSAGGPIGPESYVQLRLYAEGVWEGLLKGF